MWASGKELRREAQKKADDKTTGTRRFINLAALKKQKEMRRKAATGGI